MGAPLIEPVASDYLVPFDGSFSVAKAATAPPRGQRKKKREHKEALEETIAQMRDLQRALYARDTVALLLIFQAMDAAGKDGTIRAVMSGINPAGCQVSAFKAPSNEELDHDFLWRIYRQLPERGRIGIFNRSHYEEVLVVRVHPEFLEKQRLPGDVGNLERLWTQRYESIRNFEEHLSRNGTVIVKFWLNVSQDEQRERFLERIEEPEANWKFQPRDVHESRHWTKYMNAYEAALNATSRPWAPWYAVPADDKPFMRRTVADIVLRTMRAMKPTYPKVSDAQRAEMEALRVTLEAERKKG